MIDNNKLKVKYILGNYKDLPSYPQKEDLLYVIVQSFIGNTKKDLQFNDVWLLKTTSINNSTLNSILELMLKDGDIEIVRKSQDKTIYRLLKNPFVSDSKIDN